MDFRTRIKELIKTLLDNVQEQRKVILALGCLVVFITTYMLILPAFTLDKAKAAKQGGIDVPGVELSADDDSTQAESAAAEEEGPEAKDDAKSDTKNSAKATQKAAKSDDASKAKSKSQQTVTLQNEESDDFVVAVEGDGNDLSEDMSVEVREIDQSDKKQKKEYESLYNDALEAVQKAQKEEGLEKPSDFAFAKFYDISLMDGRTEVEPEAAVDVKISFSEALQKELAKQAGAIDSDRVHIVHFAVDKETGEVTPEVLDSETTDIAIEKNRLTEATFTTDSFSVFAVVYTVDFSYTVDGKNYEFSLPGGGYASFIKLVEVLGIAQKDGQADSGDKAEAEEDAAQVLTLNDVKVSDATRDFVAEVEKVEFSSPELVSVSKVDENTTVGAIKEKLGLECEYSSDLTEEDIAKINATKAEAGDWALISLKPFDTEETLTVTMKNGDVFTVSVTDALHVDPDALVGKEIVIYDKTEMMAMTSNYATDYRTHFNTISYTEGTGTPDSAHWTVEKHNNNYYLKSNTGKYLTLDQSNVNLVDNWNQATALTIQMGGNPDYQIYPANNGNAKLTYCENNQYDGFFSAPNGANGAGTTRQWLGIDYAVSTPDPVGDWMLYFDDDFDEITIHVGETISLRPYKKWEWKEDYADVQSAHWNIGGKDDSFWNQIDSGDANGAHKSEWDDGGNGTNTAAFHWTAYVKKDTELVTHYWSVQGRATQTGVYYLTNTKNGRTIKVNVVDGDPVNQPPTITNTVDIPVNLFDYDKNYKLDPTDNTNIANNNNNKSDSTNAMGNGNHFYFMSSGAGNSGNQYPQNNYTQGAANTGILKNQLGENGYPELSASGLNDNNRNLKYLFDTSESATSWHGGNSDGMIAYPNVNGMFQKDSEGYYYYNSNTNYFFYNPATGESKLYEHTYTQTSSKDKGSLVNDKPIGFFPFHDYDATDNLYVNQNHVLNHHLGMSMEIPFKMNETKTDEEGNPIKFEFTGDDDLWVFAEWVDAQGNKQSKLILDVGGIHQPVYGYIDFTEDNSSSLSSMGLQSGVDYKLKVYYLERGGCDSNHAIRFNIPLTNIGDVPFTKRDALTNDPLPGAMFGLYKDEGCTEANKVRQATSDENGHVLFNDVSLGTYYMKEITPPNGYHPSTAVYRVEVKAKNNAEVTLINGEAAQSDYRYSITNEPIQLTVRKVWLQEEGTSKPNEIYFKLYKKGNPDTEITNKDGYDSEKGYILNANNEWTASFKELDDGQYYVVEGSVDDYSTMYAAKIVDTDEDTSVVDTPSEALAEEDGNLTILNKPYGYLKIYKEVKYNGQAPTTTTQKKALKGTYTFKVYTDQNCSIPVMDGESELTLTATIGDDGASQYSNTVSLPTGTYWLKEILDDTSSVLPLGQNPQQIEITAGNTSTAPKAVTVTNDYEFNEDDDNIAVDIVKTFTGLDASGQIPEGYKVVLKYTNGVNQYAVELGNSSYVTEENLNVNPRIPGGVQVKVVKSTDGLTWTWHVYNIAKESTGFSIHEENYEKIGYSLTAYIDGEEAGDPMSDHPLAVNPPTAVLTQVTDKRITSENDLRTYYVGSDYVILVSLNPSGTLVISDNSLNFLQRSAIQEAVEDGRVQGSFSEPVSFFSTEQHPASIKIDSKRTITVSTDSNGKQTVYLPPNTNSMAVGFYVTYDEESVYNNCEIENRYTEVGVALDIFKVDATDMSTPLENAKFELKKLDPEDRGSYLTGDAAVTIQSEETDENGATSIGGITTGYYELVETKTPAGYVKIDDVKIYIWVNDGVIHRIVKTENDPETTDVDESLVKNWTVVGDNDDGTIRFHAAQAATEDTEAINATFTIGNTPGAALPHTGGIGTTIFYIFGTILVAVTGMMLWKRRKAL